MPKAPYRKKSAKPETRPSIFSLAFADDVAKTNLTAILQQHGMDNVRSL